MSENAERFDNLRKIRNSINYYGRKVSNEEAYEIIREMKSLIKEVKGLLKR